MRDLKRKYNGHHFRYKIKEKNFEMKKYLLLWIAGWGLLLTSCISDAHLTLPEEETKLVVNGFFHPDSSFALTLSASSPVLSSYEITRPVPNAVIKLFENGTYKDSLIFNGEKYISSYIPQVGKEYGISIHAAGYDEVSATNVIPPTPQVLNIRIIPNYILKIDEQGEPFFVSGMNLTLFDNLSESHFYEVVIYIKNTDENNTNEIWEGVDYIRSDDAVINFEEIINYNPPSIVFSNENFSNSVQEIHIDFTSSLTTLLDEYKVMVICRSVSEDYYLFAKSYARQTYFDPFSYDLWTEYAYVNLYSNIKGGLGIFAAYNEIRDTISIIND